MTERVYRASQLPRRRMLFAMPAAVLFHFLLSVAPAAAQPSTAAAPKLKTVMIPVERMVCPVCVLTVRRTIRALDGALEVDVSLEKQAVRVTFDANKLSAEQIAAAVNRIGYKAGVPQEVD